MFQVQTVVIRLALAAFCGGVIGYQRERKDRPAGFRTHILVSLGSALFMLVSVYNFGVPTDPTRIAAQVVTGIGFLGAGTIIRQGNYIVGLTTAASLWSVSAVGLAAGAGYYLAAVSGAIMIFFVLSFFKVLESRLVSRRHEYLLTMTADASPHLARSVNSLLTKEGYEIIAVDKTKSPDGHVRFVYEFRAPTRIGAESALERISELEGVNRVRLEEAPEVPGQLFGSE